LCRQAGSLFVFGKLQPICVNHGFKSIDNKTAVNSKSMINYFSDMSVISVTLIKLKIFAGFFTSVGEDMRSIQLFKVNIK
jgi:hypothetical protein